jgi:hypothetical protein
MCFVFINVEPTCGGVHIWELFMCFVARNTRIISCMFLQEFGTIVYDLVYHVIKEKGYVVPRWGVWNEPNGATEFFKCYPGDAVIITRLIHFAICSAAGMKFFPRPARYND